MPLHACGVRLDDHLKPKMTIKGGTTQACAACKFQRRRCSSDCPLAPYFPANQPKMFQNAHRLYGVSNIMKILKQLDDNAKKEEAMKSIIYESDMREKFPVHGCRGIICRLHYQLRLAIEELHYVYAQLAICREKSYNQIPSNVLQLGLNPSNDIVLSGFQQYSAGINEIPFEMDEFGTNENNGVYVESRDYPAKSLFVNDPCYEETMQNNFTTFRPHQETQAFQDFDGMQIETIADDRQSYIESKEACESSSESSLKDSTQLMINEQASNSELRSAAACFSLTS